MNYHYSGYINTSTRESTVKDITVPTETTVTTDQGKTAINPDEDGVFLYIVMAAVGAFVLLIMMIIITVFIIKSMKRKRQNLQRLNERQQRPLTVSLEGIDRDDDQRETINAVSQELYGQQDSRLPVTVFGNASHQEQTFQTFVLQDKETRSHRSGSSQMQSRISSNEKDRTTANNENNGRFQQVETLNTVGHEYENTKISNQNLTSEQPLKTNIPTNESPSTQQDKHDYETAFRMSDDLSKREYENVITTSKPTSTISFPSPNVKHTNGNLNQLNIQQHTTVTTTKEVTPKNETASKKHISSSKAKKLKPKVQPKPTTRTKTFIDNSDSEYKTKVQGNNVGESQNYENSLGKSRRTEFSQGKLLSTVPPPRNTITAKSKAGLPMQRRSSEYEDPETALSLFEGKNVQSNKSDVKMTKRSESGSKSQEQKYNTQECKQTSIKLKKDHSKLKPLVSKPDYANISVQNPSASKNDNNTTFDYENEDTVNELKSTLKRLRKRGFSTSCLDSGKQEMVVPSGSTNKQSLTDLKVCSGNEDEYLPMDAITTDDAVYLPMNERNCDLYMRMVPPEEQYIKMKSDLNCGERKTKPLPKTTGSDLPKGYRTAPKPCGGVYSARYVNVSDQPISYVNFSDQSIKYVNFFRSRSIDDVYTCADRRSNIFKSKND